MFTAVVRFRHEGRDEATLTEFIQGLLSCWHHNGQILGYFWTSAENSQGRDVYVTIPDTGALDCANDNHWVNAFLSEATTRGYARPTVEILGRSAGDPIACSCREVRPLLLCPYYLNNLPPITCLSCARPVPLHRLPPIDGGEHLTLLQWASDYRACDMLWMHSTVGEDFVRGQLFDHDSELNRVGRELCRMLEALWGGAVYCQVQRFFWRDDDEPALRDRCPACGDPCRVDHSRRFVVAAWCDACRIGWAPTADGS